LSSADARSPGSSWPASRPASASSQTARAANERGYELTIVTDAITDTNKGAHLNSLTAIFPQIAELAMTEEVLTALRVSIASTSADHLAISLSRSAGQPNWEPKWQPTATVA
jgi:hypothetical protein